MFGRPIIPNDTLDEGLALLSEAVKLLGGTNLAGYNQLDSRRSMAAFEICAEIFAAGSATTFSITAENQAAAMIWEITKHGNLPEPFVDEHKATINTAILHLST